MGRCSRSAPAPCVPSGPPGGACGADRFFNGVLNMTKGVPSGVVHRSWTTDRRKAFCFFLVLFGVCSLLSQHARLLVATCHTRVRKNSSVFFMFGYVLIDATGRLGPTPLSSNSSVFLNRAAALSLPRTEQVDDTYKFLGIVRILQLFVTLQ